MAERRSEDAVYYDHMGTPCRDSEYHRRCSGRWRGEINLGKDGTGKRQRVKVSAKNKTDVYEKLKQKRRELDDGIKTSSADAVNAAVEAWLNDTMGDRQAKTVQTIRERLKPLLAEIGETPLRDLEADDVTAALAATAGTRSTRTVRDTKAHLVQAINYAQARGRVARNVAALVKAPPGKAPGRPSRSLTPSLWPKLGPGLPGATSMI
jgi:hypothetical protein